ncbi:hypothetical protein A33M_1521 [Rhodovulum sp. PH10]|uniref:flagellar biosynthetic protein FliO n=1 Tax=Rhodovulum sp. PH10 TaxID=1187851 RepID=UPI00027C1F5E|nr:flagellar biosynthetic protein FliO [Rhodovulum sp. PH10]EJW09374.1 hypothetical protein A33M_1521 [Rhodovulum sp. PH10]
MDQALKFFIAFVIVLALIGAVAWLVRRFGAGGLGSASSRGRQARLGVIEATAVDNRRRLVLVRRDNVEHLIMLGGPSDLVVEANIVRGQPAGAAREMPTPRMPEPVRGPENGMWPAPPEPPFRGSRASERAMMPPVGEELPLQPHPEPPLRPQTSDRLAGLAAEIARTASHSPEPRIPEPRVAEQRAEPRVAEPPRLADPRMADRLGEPRVAEPRVAEPRFPEPRYPEQRAEPRALDPRPAEHAPEPRQSEPRLPDFRLPEPAESRPQEPRAQEPRAPLPDFRHPEPRHAEERGETRTETRPPETRPPEMRASEMRRPEPRRSFEPRRPAGAGETAGEGADHHLAAMAEQLEAALRRPGAAQGSGPASSGPAASGTAIGESAAAAPEPAPAPPVPPPAPPRL